MDKRLSIKDLSYKIPFGESILEGLSFDIGEGQFYGVLGKNGAGKTTIIDLILGGRSLTGGSLLVLGEDPLSLNRKNSEKISFLSQEISLKGNITIAQFLKFHSDLFSNYSTREEKKICNFFGLDLNIKIGALSTGQQKKIQIVSGFASMPDLLIIDEITAVLDPETRSQFFELLINHKKQYGTSILLATNIAEDLIGRADKVLFLSDKTGKEYSPEDINKLFNLDVAA